MRDGVAEVRTYADNRAMAGAMLEDEARARVARRGLWGQGVFQVRLPSEIGPRTDGFQIVEGTPRVVTPTRQGVYLDFNDDKRGFAVLVNDKALPDFAAAGDPIQGLVGRLIRVRGVVGWNAAMAVDHPEQVELLGHRP